MRGFSYRSIGLTLIAYIVVFPFILMACSCMFVIGMGHFWGMIYRAVSLSSKKLDSDQWIEWGKSFGYHLFQKPWI